MTITVNKTGRGFAPIGSKTQSQAPHSHKNLDSYRTQIEQEFTRGSAIAPGLFQEAITLVSDVEVEPGGEVFYPIHQALNWKIKRFGHQARPTIFAAFLNNEDGSVWQSKLNQPLWDPKKGKPRKYESPAGLGSKAYFPPVDPETRERIAQRWGISLSLDHPFWASLDHQQPIVITEGGKKSLCLLSHGHIAIALYGVNGGYRTKDQLGNAITPELIDDLKPFCRPGQQIYLAFDQDEKQTTRQKVSRAIARFGGLLEQAGCQVHVVTWDGKDGKGVDDLIVNQGVEAWDRAYKNAVPLNLWEISERLSHQLTYPAALAVNCPDLSEISLADLPERGTMGISSAKGTGKTNCMARLLENEPIAVGITHRIALGRNLCHRWGLGWRNDLDKAEGQWFDGQGYTKRIGLCIDSLLAIDPHEFKDCVLVIDEVEQVIRHLLQSTTCQRNGKLPALLARLRELVQGAKRVIIADADLSDKTLEYFQQLRGEAPFLIRNQAEAQGYQVELIEAPTRGPIVARFLDDAKRGLKLFVTTDSLRVSQQLSRLCEGLGLKHLLINSRTSGNQEQQQFMANPDAYLQLKDPGIVIASPSMATGVSIESDYFDRVYGIFSGASSTDADLSQGLIRVRCPVLRIVWCSKAGKGFCRISRSTVPQQITKTLMQATTVEASLLRGQITPAAALALEGYDWEADPNLELWAKLEADRNHSMRCLGDHLRVRLQWEGHHVSVISAVEDPDIKRVLETVRQAIKIEDAQKTVQADILDAQQAKALAAQDSLSYEEQLAILRFAICEFYGIEPAQLTSDDVLRDRYGRTRRELMELEALLHPELAVDHDARSVEAQAAWGKGVVPWSLSSLALRTKLRQRLGLMDFIDPEMQWCAEDKRVIAFAQQARQFAPVVKTVLNFTIKDEISDVQILNQLLRQVGIKAESHRYRKPGAVGRRYCLAEEHWQWVMGILERRMEVIQPLEFKPKNLGDGSSETLYPQMLKSVVDEDRFRPVDDPSVPPWSQGKAKFSSS